MKKNTDKNVLKYNRDAELYFRVGLRHASRQMYGNALKFLYEAAGKEPYNPDYQFNLACVLAELREVEKSNDIFKNIVRDIDPTFSECYFGIACNYFDTGDFKKAREYFEKYILFDAEGELVEEAYDVLHYLSIYSDIGSDAKKEKVFDRLIKEAVKLLQSNEPSKAVSKLEKALDINPEAILERGILAFALFKLKDYDKAEVVAKSALKLDISPLLAFMVLYLIHSARSEKELANGVLNEIANLEVHQPDILDDDITFSNKLMLMDAVASKEQKQALSEVLDKKMKAVKAGECFTTSSDVVVQFNRSSSKTSRSKSKAGDKSMKKKEKE